MKVRKDGEGNLLKRSIIGPIDEYLDSYRKKNPVKEIKNASKSERMTGGSNKFKPLRVGSQKGSCPMMKTRPSSIVHSQITLNSTTSSNGEQFNQINYHERNNS